MKKILLLLCAASLTFLSTNAQTLKVKKFKKEPMNAEAAKNKVKDSNDQNCALILVDVVGVGNIKFSEAVGETKYALNEYKVYVPQNTKRLSYTYGNKTGTYNLDSIGIELESLCTYRLTMENTENKLRSAVFYIEPLNALLTFDGKPVSLDENGVIAIDRPIGTYTYSVSASGYEEKSGSITLTEDEINHTENITLQQKMHNVALSCPVKEATLFIDNEPYGTIAELGDCLRLSEGEHSYRITCDGYKEVNGNVLVNDDTSKIIEQPKKLKGKTIKHNELQTKTNISFRNSFDILFSGSAFMKDDFKSCLAQLELAWNQHLLGIFTLREGLSGGVGYASDDYSILFDKYYLQQKDDKKHEAVPAVVQIPIQAGVTLPLSRSGRVYVELLGGVYGSYYYTGHKNSDLEGDYTQSVQTELWDWGLRVNALFYLNKVVIGFEGSNSMYNENLGMQVGVKIGYKITL